MAIIFLVSEGAVPVAIISLVSEGAVLVAIISLVSEFVVVFLRPTGHQIVDLP